MWWHVVACGRVATASSAAKGRRGLGSPGALNAGPNPAQTAPSPRSAVVFAGTFSTRHNLSAGQSDQFCQSGISGCLLVTACGPSALSGELFCHGEWAES
ncbi:unnamed protein product [Protopolystoma xenopodis]|uniref:Uncharacterized protein n=1 Tax=Protopolystoma xenopodis TaxID=117903 RepID=A0A3S5A3Q1_9PLAT|nr:unnamed protein product [Protopolystoma xenopodis]